MMPNLEAMNLMRSCARSGRKFRTLKTDLQTKMDDIRKKMNDACEDMQDLRTRISLVDADIKRQGKRPERELIKIRGLWRQDYRNANAEYAQMRQHMEALIFQLKEEEKVWIGTMRKLNDIHDTTLTNSGLLKDENVPYWNDADYEIQSVGPAPEIMEFDETVPDLDDDAEKNDAAAQPALDPEAKALRVKEMERRRKYSELENALTCARHAHEKHRGRYGKLLREYIEQQEEDDNREVTHIELATEFAPIFFTQWQELRQAYRAAKDALAAFVQTQWEKGIMLHLSCDHENVAVHEAGIAAEGKASLERLNWEKIESWMDTDIDMVKIAETVVEDLETSVVASQDDLDQDAESMDVDNAGEAGDNVTAEKEIAIAEDVEEPRPAKVSQKRKATSRIEPNRSKKRVRNVVAPSEEPEEPVIRVQKRNNLRARKAPVPEPAPKGAAPQKKATNGKETIEKITDEELDVQSSGTAAKKTKGKEPAIAKSKGKEAAAKQSATTSASTATKSKKRPWLKSVKEVASPLIAKLSRFNNKNDIGNDTRSRSPSPLAHLATIPVNAPLAISNPLRIGDIYHDGGSVAHVDPEYRFKTELWCKKVRGGYL